MKRAIVYQTQTGFSEQYAKWLNEDLEIELLDFKSTKKMDLNEYDELILVGSVSAGRLPLFNSIISRYNNKLVILAVGFTEDPNYGEMLKKENKIADDLFYVRGGLCYEKLGFLTRRLLKKITGVTESVSYANKDNLEPIVKYLKEEN